MDTMHTPQAAPAPAAPRTDHTTPPAAAAPGIPQKMDARAFLTKFSNWRRNLNHAVPVIPFVTRNADLTLRESLFV
ncbi:MAG: hypothetical protein ACK4Q5_05205 [Saprospiraceae bacterium]